MCGRVALHDDKQFLEEVKKTIKEVEHNLKLQPSYNIAPSQAIATLTSNKVYQYTRFGLIPHWAKDSKFQPINARAETLAEKPTFRTPFKSNRCIIPVNGFYEWKKVGNYKVPYWVYPTEKNYFALAGICDTWHDPSTDEDIISTAIITTKSNDIMKPIHDRTPVILEPKDWQLWLDAEINESEALTPLLKPFSDKAMQAYIVSTFVNSPTNNTKQCIEPQKDALF